MVGLPGAGGTAPRGKAHPSMMATARTGGAPIREAIRKPERDGLVRYLPRRGAVVVKLSREEVRDIYYLRAHLEAYAIASPPPAAHRRT